MTSIRRDRASYSTLGGKSTLHRFGASVGINVALMRSKHIGDRLPQPAIPDAIDDSSANVYLTMLRLTTCVEVQEQSLRRIKNRFLNQK